MKDIVFSSFTNNRKPQFQTATLICVENDKKSVEKRALCKQATAHLQIMQVHYKALKQQVCGSDIDVVPCRQKGEALVFDFVQGPTIERVFLGVLQQEGKAALVVAIQALFSKLSALPSLSDFAPTARFEAVFGKVDLPPTCKAYPFSNVDLNFDNLIVQNTDNLTIIDYEWCFDFPVPLRYVFYRALWTFQEKHKLQALQLFASLGFSAKELATFSQMDEQLNVYIFDSVLFDRCVPGPVFLKEQLQPEVLQAQLAKTTQELKTTLQEINDLATLAQDRAVLLENLTKLAQERAAWITKLDADVAELKQTAEQQAQIIEQQTQTIGAQNAQLSKKWRFFR